MSLFSELKQRNVFRAAAAYVAVSWLLIQVVETLFPVFGLSDAAIRTVVIVLAIGFVPAVIGAWAFELTPQGLVRDGAVDRSSPAAKASGKRYDRLILVVLAVALGYFALDKFLLDPARDQAREEEISAAAREEGRAEAAREKLDGPPMVAVLPFAALGDSDDVAFFAAGVHDDLLTQLAQLQAIRVISRTSVMEYRDVERNIRDIGAALGADAILEGSVQLIGERIRINAQLIDAREDEHLWAKTFDSELTPSSIFDVQTEIAQAIAAEMHGTLTTQAGAGGPLLPTNSMAAYRKFHEALAYRDTETGGTGLEAYRQMLLEAAEHDPAYTRPLAELVGSLGLSAFGTNDPELVARADNALQRIEAVAPGSADHLMAQAYYTYYILQDYELAHGIATRALELAPSDDRLIEMRAWIERRLGDWDAVIESVRMARRLNPRESRLTQLLVSTLMVTHRYDAAEAEADSSDLMTYSMELTRIDLDFRHHRDPAVYLENVEALHADYGDEAPPIVLWLAYVLNRDYAAAEAMLDKVPGPEEAPRARNFGFPDWHAAAMATAWLQGNGERLASLRAEAEVYLDAYRAERGEFAGRALLGSAMMAALHGDAEESGRLLRRWDRTAGRDRPERMAQLDVVCQIHGMAGAAEAAVDCLREGLEQPSYITPFMVTLWPFYDPVRDTPVFRELAAELEVSLQET